MRYLFYFIIATKKALKPQEDRFIFRNILQIPDHFNIIKTSINSYEFSDL